MSLKHFLLCVIAVKQHECLTDFFMSVLGIFHSQMDFTIDSEILLLKVAGLSWPSLDYIDLL